MFMSIALGALGFVIGVLVTGALACQVIDFLHGETVGGRRIWRCAPVHRRAVTRSASFQGIAVMSRNRSPRASLKGRLLHSVAALVGVGVASTAPVAAQSVTPSAAPLEWVRYAESATTAVNGWLQSEDEVAGRLRAYLDATRPAPDQPTAPIIVKLWIDGKGLVSRIDFRPFVHAEANADLRGLIVGRRLPGAPPRDMLLPLRIAVQLDAPAPEPVSGRPIPVGDSRKRT